MQRLTEQQAKQILFNAQAAGYPNKNVPEILAPLYGYIEQIEAENAALRADNAEITETLQNIKSIMEESEGIAGWHKNGDISPWDEGLFQDVVKSLSTPHSGDSLFKELEALRKVAEESKQLAFANVFCNSSMTETCVGCVFKGLCDALAAVKGESNQTTWHENGEFWECEKCGYAFTLTGGSPVEHEISYCPKCGRQIAEFVTKGVD